MQKCTVRTDYSLYFLNLKMMLVQEEETEGKGGEGRGGWRRSMVLWEVTMVTNYNTDVVLS